MDVGETIKFRVIDEEFTESEPTGPPEEGNAGTSSSSANQSTDHNSKPPYKIIGAINEAGLGMDSWWTQNDGGGGDEEEEEDDE